MKRMKSVSVSVCMWVGWLGGGHGNGSRGVGGGEEVERGNGGGYLLRQVLSSRTGIRTPCLFQNMKCVKVMFA